MQTVFEIHMHSLLLHFRVYIFEIAHFTINTPIKFLLTVAFLYIVSKAFKLLSTFPEQIYLKTIYSGILNGEGPHLTDKGIKH